MIFESLNQAATNKELLLCDGGMCHFHRRRDGVVTIREIIVLPECQRTGIGRRLVFAAIGGASKAIARCPADLPSNDFWEAIGFELLRKEESRAKRRINVWQWTKP